MRPPYGAYDETTVQAAYEAGWTTIMWTGTGNDTQPEADEISICNFPEKASGRFRNQLVGTKAQPIV